MLTSQQALNYYLRDSRPERVLRCESLNLIDKDIDGEAAIFIYGRFSDIVNPFAFLTQLGSVGWGSVIVLEGLEDETKYLELSKFIERWDFRPWDKFRDGNTTRAWVKSFYDGDTNGTHRPYLLKAIELTDGPVLELGSGHSSTPYLHKACEGRLLVTVDNNREWLAKFLDLESPEHRFELLPDPAKTWWLEPPNEWSVVFVDHAPGETRMHAIARARCVATYVVVHDTEELSYGVEPEMAKYRFRRDFRRARPWTTVPSDSREVWE